VGTRGTTARTARRANARNAMVKRLIDTNLPHKVKVNNIAKPILPDESG
jgi:hypothetical protein